MVCYCDTGGEDKNLLTSGAPARTTPVIRVTGYDDIIVDNYDVKTVDTDITDQGKHAHYSVELTLLHGAVPDPT